MRRADNELLRAARERDQEEHPEMVRIVLLALSLSLIGALVGFSMFGNP